MRPEPGHVREEWLCYSVSGVTNGFGVSKVRAWPLATRLHLVELGANVHGCHEYTYLRRSTLHAHMGP